LGISSAGKREASSHSMTCGAISDCAKSRTVRWSCCCSSVREKSTLIVPVLRPYSFHCHSEAAVSRAVRGRFFLWRPRNPSAEKPLCTHF
jgi:hypothetical protein